GQDELTDEERDEASDQPDDQGNDSEYDALSREPGAAPRHGRQRRPDHAGRVLGGNGQGAEYGDDQLAEQQSEQADRRGVRPDLGFALNQDAVDGSCRDRMPV